MRVCITCANTPIRCTTTKSGGPSIVYTICVPAMISLIVCKPEPTRTIVTSALFFIRADTVDLARSLPKAFTQIKYTQKNKRNAFNHRLNVCYLLARVRVTSLNFPAGQITRQAGNTHTGATSQPQLHKCTRSLNKVCQVCVYVLGRKSN